jgi:hypothetical protein
MLQIYQNRGISAKLSKTERIVRRLSCDPLPGSSAK